MKKTDLKFLEIILKDCLCIIPCHKVLYSAKRDLFYPRKRVELVWNISFLLFGQALLPN